MIHSPQTARASARPNKDVIVPLQPCDRRAKVAVSMPADIWFCPDSGAGRGEDAPHEKTQTSKRTKPMLPRERADFSAIVDRPPLKLPGGARLVFWTIVNLEVWDIGKPMARQVLAPPTGQTLLPDVPNWSWHEYGMRVGVWRFFDLFKRLKIRPTLAINARVCEDYARVAAGGARATAGNSWATPTSKARSTTSPIRRR